MFGASGTSGLGRTVLFWSCVWCPSSSKLRPSPLGSNQVQRHVWVAIPFSLRAVVRFMPDNSVYKEAPLGEAGSENEISQMRLLFPKKEKTSNKSLSKWGSCLVMIKAEIFFFHSTYCLVLEISPETILLWEDEKPDLIHVGETTWSESRFQPEWAGSSENQTPSKPKLFIRTSERRCHSI